MNRTDGRTSKQLRPVKMTKDFVIYPEGSVFIEMGNTRVLCNASIEEKVPRFLAGTGKGWVTAEYGICRVRRTHAVTVKPHVASNPVARRKFSA